MPTTPRFISYTAKEETFIVHMYLPRFVAKVLDSNGNINVVVHDDWGADIESLPPICAKMKDWFYYKNK